MHGSQGATALVGMPGFVVGAHEVIDGEWWLYVETIAAEVGCAECGSRAVGHGRARTAVRDVPVFGAADGVGVGQAPVALPRRGL